MSEEFKDLKTRLEDQLQSAYAKDSPPPGLDDPAWLPSARERERAERAEAGTLLADWLALDGTPAVLHGRDAIETVLGACGASRGYLERLLRDAGYPEPSLLIRENVDGPYGELIVPRESPLAQAYGVHLNEATDVEINVSAASFANHISMRMGVPEPEAAWLWRAVTGSLWRHTPFAALFSGLSCSRVGDRDLKLQFF